LEVLADLGRLATTAGGAQVSVRPWPVLSMVISYQALFEAYRYRHHTFGLSDSLSLSIRTVDNTHESSLYSPHRSIHRGNYPASVTCVGGNVIDHRPTFPPSSALLGIILDTFMIFPLEHYMTTCRLALSVNLLCRYPHHLTGLVETPHTAPDNAQPNI
jgi:hypothetical protein